MAPRDHLLAGIGTGFAPGDLLFDVVEGGIDRYEMLPRPQMAIEKHFPGIALLQDHAVGPQLPAEAAADIGALDGNLVFVYGLLGGRRTAHRSEEHTSELQSHS